MLPQINAGASFPEDVKPTLSVATTGNVDPVNGQLELHFSASDASGLSSALLRRNGDTVGEMLLTGNDADAVFRTPLYQAGQADTYSLSVYDIYGNRQDADTTITGTKTADGSEGPPRKGLMIATLVKQNGRWLISVFHEAEFPAPPASAAK